MRIDSWKDEMAKLSKEWDTITAQYRPLRNRIEDASDALREGLARTYSIAGSPRWIWVTLQGMAGDELKLAVGIGQRIEAGPRPDQMTATETLALYQAKRAVDRWLAGEITDFIPDRVTLPLVE